MGYNLTIDQGNSAAKIVVWLDEKPVYEMSSRDLSVAEAVETATRFKPVTAIYSTVSRDGGEIVSALEKVCDTVYELTTSLALPIIIDYETPHTLGRDRIAAAVGAMSMYPGRDILVVDMGTAITYDVVSADGHFLGGNIAPGVQMRLDALHGYTARLPKVAEGDCRCALWGVDTETALRSGAVNGVVGELTYYRNRLGEDAIVILTGGSSEAFRHLPDFDVITDKYLVNRGLNRILMYNENK